MSSRLDSIPLEGRSVEDVEADVKKAFLEFGIEMKRFDSKKSSKEPGARLRLIGLACKHAMPNRQKEYRGSADAGFKPAVQGKMIEALTGARPNPRAIQNHAATHGRKKKSPYDANELLERVRGPVGWEGRLVSAQCNDGRSCGNERQVFFGDFLKMRGRLSESGFEESFEELVEKYPKAEEYLRHTLYKDRHRWAAAFSVLKFSISSFTSS
eukprot:jgi/Undpi1/194/HiC_scaffold_1.g00191.m1